MTLPAYIYRGGEQVYAHPFGAKNVQFFGFIVRSDKASLQSEICDRFLNFPFGNRRFVAATDQVLFVFNRIERIFSRDPPDDVKGVHAEQEAAAWVLVLDTDHHAFFWYHPYMLVDSAHAVAMGREIYGFPKAYGWFSAIPDGPSPPRALTVDTVMTRQFGPGQPALPATLFEVRRAGEPAAETEDVVFETLQDFNTAMACRADATQAKPGLGEKSRLLLKNLIGPPTPMVFLKQFRDGARADCACFQAIQSCRTTLTLFRKFRIFSTRYVVELHDFDSHPVRSDLGLSGNLVAVEQAFWWNFDFEIGLSTEVWKAQLQ